MFCCAFTISAAICTWCLMVETKDIKNEYIETNDVEFQYEIEMNTIVGAVTINEEQLDVDSDDEYDDVHALKCLPCIKTSEEEKKRTHTRKMNIEPIHSGRQE